MITIVSTTHKTMMIVPQKWTVKFKAYMHDKYPQWNYEGLELFAGKTLEKWYNTEQVGDPKTVTLTEAQLREILTGCAQHFPKTVYNSAKKRQYVNALVGEIMGK